MNGFLLHSFLFLVVSVVIVVMSAFYSEPDDRLALRSVPRRLLIFVLSCAGVAGVMLLCEHFFASVT